MSEMDVCGPEGQYQPREWEPQLELTISPGSNGVNLMAWNGSNRIAVCGRERVIHVHDFDVTLNGRISLGYEISEVRFASQDLLVIAALTGDVSILKLKKGFPQAVTPVQFQRHLLAHNAPIFALDVDPSGKTFLSGGADKVVKLWSVSGQKLLGQFRKHTNAVRHLTYTADGVCFASAGDDREIIEWDTRSSNPISSIASHCGGGASALGYQPEGHLVVGHRDNNLRVFDARTKKALATYQVYENPIRSLSLHRSGQFVATSCPEDQCVSIIDLLNGVPLTTFTVKMPVKQALFLSPCDPPMNDFDTSDLLCMPGRGRKLNIFNCDLARLFEDDDRTSSHQLSQNADCSTEGVENSSEASSAPQGSTADAAPGTEENLRTLAEVAAVEAKRTAVNDRKPEQIVSKASTDVANQAPSAVGVGQESGAEMMARRARRMTLARKTIKPRRISLDDLHEQQEREASTVQHKEDPDEKVHSEHIDGLKGGSSVLNKLVAQVADVALRMELLEKMVTSRFRDLDQRVATLEERCLKDGPNINNV